jgi:hypothetical protein
MPIIHQLMVFAVSFSHHVTVWLPQIAAQYQQHCSLLLQQPLGRGLSYAALPKPANF